MARGESGRIVLEIDPSEKRELYEALTKDGMTLKDWFLRRASNYLRERTQGQLFTPTALAETSPPYRTAPASEAGVKPGKKKSKGKGQ